MFTTREVGEITGATYRQLDDWDRQGAFVPSIRPAVGSGSQRSYSAHDLAMASILVDLSTLGFQADAKGRVVDWFRRYYPNVDDFPDEVIVAANGGVIPSVRYAATCVVVRPATHRDRVIRAIPVPA
jgi:hypothetical protein